MHCFREADEKSFITVVKYGCWALISSKKITNWVMPTSLISLSKIRHEFALDSDFSRTAGWFPSKSYTVVPHDENDLSQKNKQFLSKGSEVVSYVNCFFMVFCWYLLIASMDFPANYINRNPLKWRIFCDFFFEVLSASSCAFPPWQNITFPFLFFRINFPFFPVERNLDWLPVHSSESILSIHILTCTWTTKLRKSEEKMSTYNPKKFPRVKKFQHVIR